MPGGEAGQALGGQGGPEGSLCPIVSGERALLYLGLNHLGYVIVNEGCDTELGR